MAVSVLLIVAVVLMLSTSILHDLLVRHQYLHHRDAWEADGSFDGLFWHVDGAVSATQPLGMAPRNWYRTIWLWLYRTAESVDALPPCRGLLYAFRISSLLYYAALVALIATLVARNGI